MKMAPFNRSAFSTAIKPTGGWTSDRSPRSCEYRSPFTEAEAPEFKVLKENCERTSLEAEGNERMRSRWLRGLFGCLAVLSTAAFGSVVPAPAYPGAAAILAHKVTVDRQPVYVHRFPPFNQFQWMDYGSFAMTGTVHVTIAPRRRGGLLARVGPTVGVV